MSKGKKTNKQTAGDKVFDQMVKKGEAKEKDRATFIAMFDKTTADFTRKTTKPFKYDASLATSNTVFDKMLADGNAKEKERATFIKLYRQNVVKFIKDLDADIKFGDRDSATEETRQDCITDFLNDCAAGEDIENPSYKNAIQIGVMTAKGILGHKGAAQGKALTIEDLLGYKK
jgi:uncharacterized tellurite resistance protein B-like protein